MDELISPVVFGPETLEKEMVELAHEYAPRRFALCMIDEEAADGAVHSWGTQFPDRAVLVGDERRLIGTFASAESARRFFARLYPGLILIWIDEENPETTI